MRKAARALVVGATALLVGCGTSRTVPGEAAASPAPGSDDEKTIYALGAAFGQKAVRPLRLSEAELEFLKRGISDTARGGEPAFDIAPWQAKLEAFAEARAAAAAAEEKERAQAFREQAAKEPGAVRTASGLIHQTLTAGRGAAPGPDSAVRVHYQGTLIDGTVFDSSVERGQPIEFRLNQVIPCWREGVQRMKVGEKARLVCPAEIAYGNRGAPPDIPPGATLVFEVELLDVGG